MPSSSSFLGASPSSSASSPLSYLIPVSRPPTPPLLTGQTQGYVANNGIGGVPTSSGVADVVSAASSVAAPHQSQRPPAGSSRHPGTGHPPLPRPPPRQCPRCGSANTKFCYYNNYSRSQPRYLCKACRRHWTEGGTLRDVPVGGGRKSRRGSKGGGAANASPSSSSSSLVTATALPLGVGSESADVAFPDILRQVLFQPVGAMGGGGYNIDLGAWQQITAATAPPPQDAGEPSAFSGTAMDANSGAWQYWSEWQQYE